MLSQICALQGSVYVPFKTDKTLCIYEYISKSIEGNSCQFAEKCCFTTETNVSRKYILWHTIQALCNHVTHQFMIFLFLQHHNGKLIIFYCQKKNFEYSLQHLSSYDLPVANIQDVLTTDGPTILIMENSGFSIFSPLYKIDETFNISEYSSQNVDKTLLSFQCIENILNSKETFVVLYLLSILVSNKSTEAKEIIVQTVLFFRSNNKLHKNVYLIPIQNFFPAHFQKLVKSLQIRFLNSNFCITDKNINLSTMPWKNNETFCCTSTDFFVFSSGCIIHRCKIPICDINQIILQNHSFFNNIMDLIFLQSSTAGVCCLLYKSESQHFQCIQTWPSAQKVLSSDFQQAGSQQILVVFDDTFECWQMGCLVFHPKSVTSDMAEVVEIPDQHISTTVAALNKTATSGSAAIVDAHYKIAEKTAAISDVFFKIAHSSGKDHESDTLLDIIINKDDHKCKKVHMKTDPLALKLTSIWKVFLANRWIIGYNLLNVSNSFITNTNISIILDSKPIQLVERLYKKNCNASCIEPGETFAIVVSVETSLLILDSTTLACNISWSIGKTSMHIALFADDPRLPCQQLQCNISLFLQDAFDKASFQKLSPKEQLMSLRICQETFILSITSEEFDLTSFDKILCQSPLSIRKLSADDIDHFVFEDNPLQGVNMSSRIVKSALLLQTYISNVAEGVFLVQWLCSILPQDVTILPQAVTAEEMSTLQKKLLLAIKDELDLLKAFGTNSLANISEEMTSPSQHFEVKNITLSSATYQSLRDLLIKKELVTDTIAKQLSQVT